ncbi:MAG: hypothetical protein PHY09_17315 [Desulfuromonadaceae bacterium]|nr:hypothetical protein [Desulfuromonadaceae bacterium]MDD5107409.1 hypothetical protein [Desulfuromonadaceae bacterium]
MKCPKCGFNSFEYYDQCTKCSADLTAYKLSYSITPLVLPQEAKEVLASTFGAAEHESDISSDTAENHDDMFSFDLPDESSFTAAVTHNDPFGFSEPTSKSADSVTMDDDPFANLLESTSQSGNSAFEDVQPSTSSVSAVVEASPLATEPGDFDLDSFSWGDVPADAQSEERASTESAATEDFDALFGDTDESSKK